MKYALNLKLHLNELIISSKFEVINHNEGKSSMLAGNFQKYSSNRPKIRIFVEYSL